MTWAHKIAKKMKPVTLTCTKTSTYQHYCKSLSLLFVFGIFLLPNRNKSWLSTKQGVSNVCSLHDALPMLGLSKSDKSLLTPATRAHVAVSLVEWHYPEFNSTMGHQGKSLPGKYSLKWSDECGHSWTNSARQLLNDDSVFLCAITGIFRLTIRLFKVTLIWELKCSKWDQRWNIHYFSARRCVDYIWYVCTKHSGHNRLVNCISLSFT